MINTDDILKIVKLTLLSGYIKDVKPLSLLIVGEYGSGKTEILKHFNSQKNVFLTDLTYMGLLKVLKDNEQISHITIPDYIKITNKRRSTSDNLTSFLNAVTEEGVGKISLYNFEADLKDRVVGLITAITKSSYDQNKRAWQGVGFLSRMLICSYSYKDDTINRIMEYINKEEYIDKQLSEKIKGVRTFKIESNEEMNKQLNGIASKRFRTLKQLQTLSKACALERGSKKVEQEDIEEVKRLSKYFNLKYTKL